jgi:hypothetical protein
VPAHAAMSGPKTTLSRATGTPAPTCSQISAVPNIKIRVATGKQLLRRGGARRRALAIRVSVLSMGAPDQIVHLKYRADIDRLRAVGVIAVALYHAFPSLMPGGFIGVDLSSVISGYLIT